MSLTEVKVVQSCLTLCPAMYRSFQAPLWDFPSNDTGSSSSDSCSVVPNSLRVAWTVAHQTPLSMGFSRQGYWSGLLLTGISFSDVLLRRGNLDTQIDTSDVHTQSKTLVRIQCLSATREKGFQKDILALEFCFQCCVRSGIFIFKPSSTFFFFPLMAVLEANIAPYHMSSVLVQTMLLLLYHILLNFSAYSLTI